MKYILTQHYTTEHSELFNLTSPINQKWAEKSGFQYISNNERRCLREKFGGKKLLGY